jgi:RNA polymerase sigma factor (sigma-70 family)
MGTDTELLRSYAHDRSESAFSGLVQRHIDMVYSVAFRETRCDACLAEEIIQSVFAELARKASKLERHPALAGWLFVCVRLMAANARRAEQRRHRRKLEVKNMKELLSSDSPESAWRQIQPAVDDALHQLSETDRAAVLLRFFEERPFKEVGLALGINKNAARMRVERALEKLQTPAREAWSH